MGGDRAHAVHGEAAAGAERLDRVPRLRRVRTARRSGARSIDIRTLLIVLLGGEAGLRCGEMIGARMGRRGSGEAAALRAPVGLERARATPKGGRLRRVPLTQTPDGGTREHRHLRSTACCARTTAQPLTRQIVQYAMKRAATRAKCRDGRAHPSSHVLLAPGDARRAGAGDPGARRARGSDDDAALHAPESGGARRGDPAAGATARIRLSGHGVAEVTHGLQNFGDVVETGTPGSKTINKSGQ